MRIGVFFSGIYWQDFGIRRCGYAYDLLYISRKDWKLDDYDVLVVPKGVHQGFLKEMSSRFADWVDRGGVLVSFGEADGDWLDSTRWKPLVVGPLPTIVAKSHEVFAELTDADIAEWSKAVHGYFEVIPNTATVLATVLGDTEKIVAFVDNTVGKGVILAMTLDPDYHTYSEIPNARKMLANVLRWAMGEAQRIALQHGMPRRASMRSDLLSHLREKLRWGLLLPVVVGSVFGYALKGCDSEEAIDAPVTSSTPEPGQ